MHWASAVPLAVLTASLAALPRLEAEESILAMTRVAMGTGSFKEETSRQIRKDWVRTAEGPQPIEKAVAAPRALPGMGFGSRRVKRAKPIATEAPADGH